MIIETRENANPEPNPGSALSRYNARLTALRTERSTWLYHWREIGDYLWPRRFRYLMTDRNKGYKRNESIINNKAMIALRTLAAGMMAGITSPARPWFKMIPPDQFIDDDEVKGELELYERVLRQAFNRSNIYNVLHELYVMLPMFGTAGMYVAEDQKDDFRAYLWPMGQYCLAVSSTQRADTAIREFGMTVAQLVEEFGFDKCSLTVQGHYQAGAYDQWVNVCHIIEPNVNRIAGKVDSKNKAFKSAWWEASESADGRFLRESGYDEFPVMAPRWFVTGEDVYGSGPGMDALGDVKALTLLERRKAQLIDKIVNPPMRGPMSLKSSRASLLPGDITYVPDNTNGQKFEPAIEINPSALQAVEDSISKHEQRIWSTFFADLFLMMLSDERQQPQTATEVNARTDEKMLQLGPVLDRIHDELLTPLINRCIRILVRRGKLPPPSKKLQGQNVKIEYISIMAQAQKVLGTAGIERFTSFVGSLSAVNKDILDLPNFDRIIRDYADMLGIPVDSINKDEVVQKLRQQRAQEQQQAQAAQMMTAGAQAAKTAGDVDSANLNKVLGGLGVGGMGG
jgi:hypothetical protein